MAIIAKPGRRVRGLPKGGRKFRPSVAAVRRAGQSMADSRKTGPVRADHSVLERQGRVADAGNFPLPRKVYEELERRRHGDRVWRRRALR